MFFCLSITVFRPSRFFQSYRNVGTFYLFRWLTLILKSFGINFTHHNSTIIQASWYDINMFNHILLRSRCEVSHKIRLQYTIIQNRVSHVAPQPQGSLNSTVHSRGIEWQIDRQTDRQYKQWWHIQTCHSHYFIYKLFSSESRFCNNTYS